MLKDIHKKSLQFSLKENQDKINLGIKRILILASITSIILIIVSLTINSKIYLFVCIPLSIYCLYTYFKFYALWQIKSKIRTKLSENETRI